MEPSGLSSRQAGFGNSAKQELVLTRLLNGDCQYFKGCPNFQLIAQVEGLSKFIIALLELVLDGEIR